MQLLRFYTPATLQCLNFRTIEQSMGARNRVEMGLLYKARQPICSLAKSNSRNRLLRSLQI